MKMAICRSKIFLGLGLFLASLTWITDAEINNCARELILTIDNPEINYFVKDAFRKKFELKSDPPDFYINTIQKAKVIIIGTDKRYTILLNHKLFAGEYSSDSNCYLFVHTKSITNHYFLRCYETPESLNANSNDLGYWEGLAELYPPLDMRTSHLYSSYVRPPSAGRSAPL